MVSEELKALKKKQSIKQAIMDKSMELQRRPRTRDADSLRKIGTNEDNIRIAMECVCELIFEYYGINPWEFRNAKRLEQVQMTEEHKHTINSWYNVDQKIMEFMDTKYGDEYKKQYGTPHEVDNSINIVDVPDHLVQRDMQQFIPNKAET